MRRNAENSPTFLGKSLEMLFKSLEEIFKIAQNNFLKVLNESETLKINKKSKQFIILQILLAQPIPRAQKKNAKKLQPRQQ